MDRSSDQVTQTGDEGEDRVESTSSPEDGSSDPTNPSDPANSSDPTNSSDPSNPWSGTSAPEGAFLMPSQNVACGAGAEWVACQIADRDYTPRDAFPGCRATEANTILLRAGEPAQWICSEHSMFGVQQDVGGRTLDYGSVFVSNGFTCLSDSDGVRCSEDATSHSFRLARASYDAS